jgi:hypothetical protein
MIKAPTSFTAGKKVVINGTTYQPGASVPNAVVKSIRYLSALTNNRTLIPDIDPYRRKTRARHPKPVDFGTSRLRKTL